MSLVPEKDALVAALSAAGVAHHDYETDFLGGVRDEQWPGWYAAYVLGRVGDFASASRLSEWLRDAPSDSIWADDAASYVFAQLRDS